MSSRLQVVELNPLVRESLRLRLECEGVAPSFAGVRIALDVRCEWPSSRSEPPTTETLSLKDEDEKTFSASVNVVDS